MAQGMKNEAGVRYTKKMLTVFAHNGEAHTTATELAEHVSSTNAQDTQHTIWIVVASILAAAVLIGVWYLLSKPKKRPKKEAKDD
jgi:hypothetical protein